MLKLLRFETVTSSFQHPRIIKKRNHKTLQNGLSDKSHYSNERIERRWKKKKKKNRILSKPWKNVIGEKLFPKKFSSIHTLLTLETNIFRACFNNYKNFTPKKTVRENSFPFSQHLENNYISQATFDILPSPGIDSASLHACTRPRIVRFCTCIASGAVATSRARVVPHPPRAQAWYVGDTSMPRMRRKSGSVSNSRDSPHDY